MTPNQKSELITALVEFCKRVANGKATYEETEVLPQIAEMLLKRPVTRKDDQL